MSKIHVVIFNNDEVGGGALSRISQAGTDAMFASGQAAAARGSGNLEYAEVWTYGPFEVPEQYRKYGDISAVLLLNDTAMDMCQAANIPLKVVEQLDDFPEGAGPYMRFAIWK